MDMLRKKAGIPGALLLASPTGMALECAVNFLQLRDGCISHLTPF
jgi:hypothetical protein